LTTRNAALYLGKREGKELVYMGKVGTGWSRTVSSQIRKQLDTVVSPKSKLSKQVRKPKATWVDPVFTAEVEYRDITSEGPLRKSSFKGLSRKKVEPMGYRPTSSLPPFPAGRAYRSTCISARFVPSDFAQAPSFSRTANNALRGPSLTSHGS
jgi:hypothetical protein